MRPRFVLQEIVTGLRRNLTMTVAVIVTVMISLTLLGASMLTTRIADRMHERYFNELSVAIYLKQDVTATQKATLQTELQADPEVEKTLYVSRDEALARFKKEFADQSDLVNSITGPDVLPESFQVKLKDPRNFEDISSKYGQQPGVDQVYDPQRALKPLFDLLDGVKTVARIVAIVAGAAALLTTFNTIRLAAFSRRREIGIMRLVGAGNFTIQLPFVLEGVIAGLLGAGAAVGLLALFKTWVLNGTLKSFFAAGVVPNATWGEVWGVTPWLVVLGVAVAGAASYLTSLVYVRV
ncbi:MAG TPA: permease-like cell division protein FtsX [Mycobacteriales bacterium]|nr:permease-like cell division protein FtsX [Mycobacteriales bacterium]